MDRVTYVYCLIANRRQPVLRHGRKGLPGAGAVRLIPVAGKAPAAPHGLKRWLVVSDAPLDRYGEEAINRNMSNLDWVSRAAVAHELVVESFRTAAAVLPMKLFTIFTSDSRALAHVDERRDHVDAVLKRVMKHEEWGVRVVLNRAPAAPRAKAAAGRRGPRPSGAGYLTRKKAQRDASAELAGRAHHVVADLYDRLGTHAARATRRSASELPAKGGPLLLDAAFLVARTRAGRFRAAVRKRAGAMAPSGYVVSLSGPWPPYSFMQD